ncbi:Telomerase reverse transcriptase-like protein [Aphelenchoides besseyi]|nr:Telomerase reverse transcriptase-like protein [Aphelenchoides besseyi]KAI6208120.1 Telomerase reverse transcriptase-like protein [Aphelenchoides besseyi]
MAKRKGCRSKEKRRRATNKFVGYQLSTNVAKVKELFPTVKLRCSKPTLSFPDQNENFSQSDAEKIACDIVTKSILDHIKLHDKQKFLLLTNTVRQVRFRFKRYRLWRTFDNCIPKHEHVTPLKAIRCNVTSAQLRALLGFSVNFVFGNLLLSESEVCSLISPLIELLLCPRRERFVSPIDAAYFTKLLQQPIAFANSFSTAVRKVLSENLVLYIIRHCLNILSQCFYTTLTQSGAGSCPQIAIYRRNVWKKIEAFSFAKLRMRQALIEIRDWQLKTTTVLHPFSDLRFLPKTNGTRPIGISRTLTDVQQRALRAEKLILRYLYQQRAISGNYVKPLQAIKTEIVRAAYQFRSSQIYCFHGDLLDCFNRIDFKVIEKFLVESVPLDNVYHVASVLAQRNNTRCKRVLFGVGQSRNEAERNLWRGKRQWSSLNNISYRAIKGQQIRGTVRNFAARPWIRYRGKMYEYSRGILQGSPLSDTLNEIYQIMKAEQIFTNCDKNQFFYRRYVDDYFLMSDSKNIETVIENLLNTKHKLEPQSTKKAITLARFSTVKCTSNFKSERLGTFAVACKKQIAFCGNVFDPQSKSFAIDHKRYGGNQLKRLLSTQIRLPFGQLMNNLEPAIRYYIKLFVENYLLMPPNIREYRKRQFVTFMFGKFVAAAAGRCRRDSPLAATKVTNKLMSYISRKLQRSLKHI